MTDVGTAGHFRIACATAWLTGLVWCGPVAAQVPGFPPRAELSAEVQLDEADHIARTSLERIDRFLADRQWDEAVEALRRLIETDAGRLLPIAPPDRRGTADGFARYVPLRTYCQIKLAGWSASAPEALQLYRTRVDPLVERWYQQAVDEGDEALLRRIVNRFFLSRWGDEALQRLGALALERGEFTPARAAWERISPRTRLAGGLRSPGAVMDSPALGRALAGLEVDARWDELQPLLGAADQPPRWLAYPDANSDLASVLARLVLVSILEGSPERATAERQVLARLAPDGAGTIGGRQGKYTELLGEILQQSRDWPAPAGSPDWPTFGGAAARDKVARAGVDVALQPLWQVPLPPAAAEDRLLAGVPRVAEDRERLLCYYPLVVGRTVVVIGGDRIEDIQAFDVQRGERLWPSDSRVRPAGPPVPLPGAGAGESPPQWGVPRFTATAVGHRLLAKLGPQATAWPQDERREPGPAGYLAVLDLAAERKRLCEIHLDAEPWGPGWAFDGPPLADESQLYVALRQRDSLRTQAHVAAFDLKRGHLRWRRLLAAAETPGQGRALEFTHNLLSLDAGILYCNTNLGAVAALRADDGEVEWIVRYPRAPLDSGDPDRSRRHWYRDLTPCLVHKDLVIVAPADCDRIFALDAAHGMLVWSTAPQQAVDAVHLLGVGRGQLLASGDRLYWIDVRHGQITASFPGPVEDPLRGYGRGLLAGDEVYWPTRDKIYVFTQEGLRQTRAPIDLGVLGLTGGNLVLAGDVLLVAAANQLTAFNAFGRPVGP